jgi:hypothetical protein
MDLLAYWDDNPPPPVCQRMMLSAYTDWQPKDRRTASPEQIDKAVKVLGGTVLPVETMPEWIRASVAAWQEQNPGTGRPN